MSVASIDPASSVRPSPRATYRKLADGSGAVLLHLDTAAYHGLNEAGSVIWSLIGTGTTFGELVTKLKAEVDDAPPTLADEVSAFLRDLEERDLVHINGG